LPSSVLDTRQYSGMQYVARHETWEFAVLDFTGMQLVCYKARRKIPNPTQTTANNTFCRSSASVGIQTRYTDMGIMSVRHNLV